VNGKYIKILGSKSEIINFSGDKVYPQEVESIIQEIDNVAEATVYREKISIMENIVCANVRLLRSEDKKDFITKLKQYCAGRLVRFKIPVKVNIVDNQQYGERFKKIRSTT
jgi:long-chain acyl-CoA synthetase